VPTKRAVTQRQPAQRLFSRRLAPMYMS
jgi:hypothetical protein